MENWSDFMSYILAKSKDGAILEAGECGGAVTSIFKYLLDEGLVDGVLAIRPGDDIYDGVPTFITDSEDLISTAGSYHCAPTLNFNSRFLSLRSNINK